MTPDDPRHGSRAGYIAGCRDACCGDPHYRYQKRSRMRLLNEGTQIVDATPVRERVAWWNERGVSINAIGDAAGLGYGTIAELVERKRDECLRSTVRAVLAVTWDSLPDRAHVYADLTRRRVYSLMAAGHRIDDLADVTPYLNRSGRWRYQERVTVALARAVIATYGTAAPDGGSAITRTKARNAGHLPPLAWDDPGWLAAPKDWAPEVMVEERPHGRPMVRHIQVEDAEWLADAGENLTGVCARLGLKADSLRTACKRAGRLDVYRRLADREPDREMRAAVRASKRVA